MKFKDIVKDFDLYLGSVLSGLMVVLLFVQVIARYVLKFSIAWAEEVAIILFILSVYFGASAAIKRNQHLRLAIVLDKVSSKTKLILELIGNFVFALFNIIILWGLMPIVIRLKEQGTATAVSNIPKWSYYVVLPIMFVFMTLRLIIDSKEKIYKFNNNIEEDLSELN